MKRKRRRLVSVQTAIVKLGLTPSEAKVLDTIVGPEPLRMDNGFRLLWPAPAAPLVPMTGCTATPPCSRCWACRVAEHGTDWWMKGIT